MSRITSDLFDISELLHHGPENIVISLIRIIGAFIIMELIKAVVPVALPTVFSLYFDIFDGLLQAYIFVFLTGLYIKEAVE